MIRLKCNLSDRQSCLKAQLMLYWPCDVPSVVTSPMNNDDDNDDNDDDDILADR